MLADGVSVDAYQVRGSENSNSAFMAALASFANTNDVSNVIIGDLIKEYGDDTVSDDNVYGSKEK